VPASVRRAWRNGQVEGQIDGVAGRVEDDEFSRVAVFDKQHIIRTNPLGGVNFGVARGVEIPDDLLVGVDFGHAVLVGKEHVAAGKQGGIADFPRRGVLIGPDNFAIAHDAHALLLALAGIEEIMLRQPVARQHVRGQRGCQQVAVGMGDVQRGVNRQGVLGDHRQAGHRPKTGKPAAKAGPGGVTQFHGYGE